MSTDINPYEVTAIPESYPVVKSGLLRGRSILGASFFSYAGTAIAGAIFGFWGGILGIMFGLFLASLVGFPVTVVGFVICALFSHSHVSARKLVMTAGCCGATSGFISCSWILWLTESGLIISLAAACVGALGAAAFTGLYTWAFAEHRPPSFNDGVGAAPASWGSLNSAADMSGPDTL